MHQKPGQLQDQQKRRAADAPLHVDKSTGRLTQSRWIQIGSRQSNDLPRCKCPPEFPKQLSTRLTPGRSISVTAISANRSGPCSGSSNACRRGSGRMFPSNPRATSWRVFGTGPPAFLSVRCSVRKTAAAELRISDEAEGRTADAKSGGVAPEGTVRRRRGRYQAWKRKGV
jgi:hypothetical protein